MAGRDAASIISTIAGRPFAGSVWRAHRARYSASDASGSLSVSGRYHRGTDHFPRDRAWLALYCGLSWEVCIGEIVRHVSAELLPLLNQYVISELHVELSNVLDGRHITAAAKDASALLDDDDLELPQSIAEAARDAGAEGLLVPSATLLGDALVIFPDALREHSVIAPLRSDPMRLRVDRG